MVDLTPTIQAKSDQLNADDLLTGPITIKITAVNSAGKDQPIVIKYEGDNGKPYKPCKSMRRVLVHLWGKDGNAYVGRHLTLYRDPEVKWAGEPVGGIRISHMSHINGRQVMPLTVTRNSKKQYTVEPLQQQDAGVATHTANGGGDATQPHSPAQSAPPQSNNPLFATYKKRLEEAPTMEELETLGKELQANADKFTAEEMQTLRNIYSLGQKVFKQQA